MISTNQDQLGPILANAIAGVGGALDSVGSAWNWKNGDQQIHISSKPNAIHLSLPLNEPPLTEKRLPQIASTLHSSLITNATLPGGHRIVLHENAHPIQLAVLPTQIDTELAASDLVRMLRSFCPSDSPSSPSASPIPPEAVESWAAEAKVRLTANTDGENSEPRYTIKIRGFEPVQLDVGEHTTLNIDACPLLETTTNSDTDPASQAACSLLAIGATASSHFIRPELSDDTLRYRATFANAKNTQPPAEWLAKAVQEITTALRLSRIELEALHNDPRLAAQYLSIRKITPQN